VNNRLAPLVTISHPCQSFVYPGRPHAMEAGNRLAQQGQSPTCPGDAELPGRPPQVILHLFSDNLRRSPAPCLYGEGRCSICQVILNPSPYASALHPQVLGHVVSGNPLPHIVYSQGFDPDMGHRTVPTQVFHFLFLFRRQTDVSHITSIHQQHSSVTIFSAIQYILSAAEKDIEEGHRFYESQYPGLGAYFLDSLYSDIDSLAYFAGIHLVVFDYHRMLSKRFPFTVYYRVVYDTVLVSAVLDCRRNPGWVREMLMRG